MKTWICRHAVAAECALRWLALYILLVGVRLTAVATEPTGTHDSSFPADSASETIIEVTDELLTPTRVHSTTIDFTPDPADEENAIAPPEASPLDADSPASGRDTIAIIEGYPRSIYAAPVSWTYSDPWWHGMWINTATVTGAYVATLFVLELLPEDATAWNRASISRVPFYKRWFRNIFKLGPEWDHDLFVFNYILHPYAGAAYFMCARTCGFNFWQSMLYSAAISTIGWEFGIEACMERPSIQDIFVTPLLGSLLGEGFYRAKHWIVDHDYELLGSRVFGHIVCGLMDPVNEVIGLLSPGRGCRSLGPGCIESQPLLIPSPAPGFSPSMGISLRATF